ncbi:hypothetical protein J3A98_002010 [Pseudomonas sp. BP6]|nr:hypothetical protein [Pseudomonas sp. BP6]MBP2289712.1 hypothetical protein [Pseudomonas sp. BP7]
MIPRLPDVWIENGTRSRSDLDECDALGHITTEATVVESPVFSDPSTEKSVVYALKAHRAR